MLRIKYLGLLVAFGGLIAQLGWTQTVSGYQGKHFILKTDVVPIALSLTQNAEIEAVIGRRATLTLGGSYFKGESYRITPDTADRIYSATKLVQAHAAFRLYQTGAQVAPVGAYVEFRAGVGKVTNTFPMPDAPGDTIFESGLVVSPGLATGVERIFFRRLVVDFNLYYRLNAGIGVSYTGPTYHSLGAYLFEKNGAVDLDLLPFFGASLKVGLLLF